MTLEIQVMAWYRHKNVLVFNQLKGSHYDIILGYICTNHKSDKMPNKHHYFNLEIFLVFNSYIVFKTTL
jgi:3-polyprenyl-4-hydroxybenzoate decarboxylase